jgi:hypothetical protein
VFDEIFFVPKRSIISNKTYNIDLNKDFFTEVNNFHYNTETLSHHAIIEEEEEENSEVKKLFDSGVGISSLHKKHQVSNIIVLLKAVEDFNLILSISIVEKGSQIGTTDDDEEEGSLTMTNKKMFVDKLLKDVKTIASFQQLDLKKNNKHCLVYVTTRFHSENELVSLKNKLAKHEELQAILEATNIAVVLVHDMDDYLPLIAHRL